MGCIENVFGLSRRLAQRRTTLKSFDFSIGVAVSLNFCRKRCPPTMSQRIVVGLGLLRGR